MEENFILYTNQDFTIPELNVKYVYHLNQFFKNNNQADTPINTNVNTVIHQKNSDGGVSDGVSDGESFILYENVGWCGGEIDQPMWEGILPVESNGMLLDNPTWRDCYDACQSAFPGVAVPRHEFHVDDNESWCYCLDGCPCMNDVGATSTIAPPGWQPPPAVCVGDDSDDSG